MANRTAKAASCKAEIMLTFSSTLEGHLSLGGLLLKLWLTQCSACEAAGQSQVYRSRLRGTCEGAGQGRKLDAIRVLRIQDGTLIF